MSTQLVTNALGIVEKLQGKGKIKIGINEVTKAIERGTAKLVLIADDVTPKELIIHLPIIAKEKGIPILNIPTREELGKTSGLNVGTSAIAIIDAGEQKTEIQELAKKIKVVKE